MWRSSTRIRGWLVRYVINSEVFFRVVSLLNPSMITIPTAKQYYIYHTLLSSDFSPIDKALRDEKIMPASTDRRFIATICISSSDAVKMMRLFNLCFGFTIPIKYFEPLMLDAFLVNTKVGTKRFELTNILSMLILARP